MNFKTIFAASLILSSITAFAGTSDTLFLKGTVASLNDITVNADAAATSLDILAGASSLKVASVSEKSNDRDRKSTRLNSSH